MRTKEEQIREIPEIPPMMRRRDFPYRSGPIIKKLRREKRLTQEQLALRLDVSRSAVANWETCLRAPSVEQYCKMSKIFGVNITDLF